MININLIAERRARKLREMRILRWSVFGLGVLLLAMVVLNVTEWMSWQNEERKLLAQTEELTQLQQQRDELQAILLEINRKGPIVDLLDEVRVSEGAWMTVLADLSNIIPDNVFLTDFSSSGGGEGMQLRLNGKAPDQKTVGAFMLDFSERTAWANPVNLSTIEVEKSVDEEQKLVRFSITVPVRGLLGGAVK